MNLRVFEFDRIRHGHGQTLRGCDQSGNRAFQALWQTDLTFGWRLANAADHFAGTGRWQQRYRYGGKARTVSFGSCPLVTIGEAREKANKARALLREDIDPVEHRRAQKADIRRNVHNTFGYAAKDPSSCELLVWITYAFRTFRAIPDEWADFIADGLQRAMVQPKKAGVAFGLIAKRERPRSTHNFERDNKLIQEIHELRFRCRIALKDGRREGAFSKAAKKYHVSPKNSRTCLAWQNEYEPAAGRKRNPEIRGVTDGLLPGLSAPTVSKKTEGD